MSDPLVIYVVLKKHNKSFFSKNIGKYLHPINYFSRIDLNNQEPFHENMGELRFFVLKII